MPMYDYKYLLENSDQTLNDGDYSTNEVNFGVTNPNLGGTGKMGLHIVITTAVTDATEGIIIWVIHGAATAPTTKLVGRFFALASLAVGKHYFIPMPKTLLQYARALFSKVTTDSTLGKAVMWFGPDEDGAE